MSLACDITQVTPLLPKRIFLQWDLVDPTESGSYTFTVERSGSTAGPWQVLAADLTDTYHYFDDFTAVGLDDNAVAHPFSLQRQFYYRVQATPPSGSANTVISVAHGIEPELPPVQRGLRRKLRYEESLLWKAYSGVRLAVVKRKHWGTRCNECWDATTNSVLKEHCLTCYGTSFVGGYWNPVLVYGRIHPPHNVTAQTTQRDKNESSQHLITLLDVPSLQDGDLIVELDLNRRHLVRRQTQTELKRHSVHQQVTTALLEHGSVEYALPVDADTTPPLL